MVVVVVSGGDVVVVVAVVDVVVVEGADGSSVAGGALLASGATTVAKRGGAVVGGTVTLVEVIWSGAVGPSGTSRDDEPAWGPVGGAAATASTAGSIGLFVSVGVRSLTAHWRRTAPPVNPMRNTKIRWPTALAGTRRAWDRWLVTVTTPDLLSGTSRAPTRCGAGSSSGS
jgi:hypothetical protein